MKSSIDINAAKYCKAKQQIKALEKALKNAFDENIKHFGYEAWYKAIGRRSPIFDRNGTLEVHFGENISHVAEYISDKATRENRTVSVDFNGTPLIANPGDSVDEVLIKWEKERPQQRWHNV